MNSKGKLMSPDREPTAEVVHDCPREGESVTLCCGRSPFELPWTDRMTVEPDLVTCGVAPMSADPQDPVGDFLAALAAERDRLLLPVVRWIDAALKWVMRRG